MFEKELKMVENALENEQGEKELRVYLKPLVEEIADKYALHKSAQSLNKEELVNAGWKHLDFALRKYKEKTDSFGGEDKKTYLFSTYFNWYVRQGIVEYIKSKES